MTGILTDQGRGQGQGGVITLATREVRNSLCVSIRTSSRRAHQWFGGVRCGAQISVIAVIEGPDPAQILYVLRACGTDELGPVHHSVILWNSQASTAL